MVLPIKNKKSKIKQKRRRIAFCLIVLFFLFICTFVFHARNYEKNYVLNDFMVKESYNKNQKVYTYEIKKEDSTWNFIIEHKYLTKKKLIHDIQVFEKDNTICIIPKSKKLTTYPECLEDKKQIDYHLVNDTMKENIKDYIKETKEQKDTYEKIDIKNLLNHDYYIWNYKGFYRITKEKQETITLFSKDIYHINQVVQINHILVVPDYDASYYFNKFYLINMKDGKQSTWEFKNSLYFDGYYLGKNKNSLFYVDKKTKTEWELIPKKKKMRKIGTEEKEGKILVNGEWKKISLNKLVNNLAKFEAKEIYHYEINQGLYVSYLEQNNPIQISKKDVKEIVAIKENGIFYLVDDTLYYFSKEIGEVAIMSYFEWNFNNQNMIFID